MQIDSDVNPVFDAWRSSTGPQKELAFQRLVILLEKLATAICWQRLPDFRNEFGPLVNEIVWRAVKNANAFKGNSRFSTWFYRISVNECNRFLRKHKERLEIGFEEEILAEPSGVDASVALQQIVQGLDDRDFELFKLVAHGESFRTIAESLHIKETAAKVRWSRLKRKLKDVVE
jgi:RNA polymerase sigma-70 factor (ECF subfamily)